MPPESQSLGSKSEAAAAPNESGKCASPPAGRVRSRPRSPGYVGWLAGAAEFGCIWVPCTQRKERPDGGRVGIGERPPVTGQRTPLVRDGHRGRLADRGFPVF